MTKESADSNDLAAESAGNRGPHARARVVELLDRVQASNVVSLEELAEALMVRPSSIAAYQSGRRTMPLTVQLLLVALTIERVPEHRRIARQLQAQIKATITYASGETVTHSDGRPTPIW
jgi:transcriptional regulator with XRE-family HTH domain